MPILTKVVLTVEAVITRTASRHRLDADTGSWSRPRSTGTERDDFARRFMPDDQRRGNRSIPSAVDAVKEEKISST